MQHTLMQLPYSMDALSPYMSSETLEYHYGKHHLAYVNKLNELIIGTEYENLGLEEIIVNAKQGPIFNNAAQIWNHNFFWNSLKVNQGQQPGQKTLALIEASFGNLETMKTKFKEASLSRFGSGWVWLVEKESSVEIYSSANAENPLTLGGKALIGLDVWEHSYYIDYRNDRAKFVDNFWNIVNWDFVESQI